MLWFIGVIVVSTGALAIWSGLENSKVNAHWRQLEREPAGERFREEMVAGVPEPGRRYLLHSIESGARLATSFEVWMEGRFRGSPKAAWMPMRAREILSMPGGFVWKASIGGLMRISGSDRYLDGEGGMQWRFWGLIPVVRASGPDISRSARGRYAVEAAVWAPATLLPANGAQWQSIDDETVRVSLTIDGETFPLMLTIAADGALREVVMDRWGNYGAEDGAYTQIPFGAVCSDARTVDGITIPAKWRIGWRPGAEDYFEFFEAELTNIRYGR